MAAEGSKSLKVTLQFVSHQALNLGAIWFKQQVGDFKQLNLEQDGQCSKKGKPTDKVRDDQHLYKGF